MNDRKGANRVWHGYVGIFIYKTRIFGSRRWYFRINEFVCVLVLLGSIDVCKIVEFRVVLLQHRDAVNAELGL